MARTGAKILKLERPGATPPTARDPLPGAGAAAPRPPMLPFLQEILDSFVEVPARRKGPADRPADAPGPRRSHIA